MKPFRLLFLIFLLVSVNSLFSQQIKTPPAKEKETPKQVNTPPQKQSTIIVNVDAECMIFIDGVSSGVVTPEDVKQIKVQPGEHLIVAKSKDGKTFLSKQTVSVEDKKSKVVDFKIAVTPASEKNETPIKPAEEPLPENSFKDSRDAKIYKFVKIGTQTWMAKNLNYTTSTGSWCYDINNCNKYGRLYDWESAIKVCPSGWHLPSDDEWKKMEMFLGMSITESDNSGWRGTDEGKKLKSRSDWSNSGNGTDTYGFYALPGGYRNGDGVRNDVGGYGSWWSSTENGTYSAWNRGLNDSDGKVYRSNYDEHVGLSVRCLKDN